MKVGLLIPLVIFLQSLFSLRSGAQMMATDHKMASYRDVKRLQNGYSITKNEEIYIKAGAERVVKRFMDLLNFISTGLDLEIPEIEKVIRESYLLPESKIFYDSTAVIEDDLRNVDINKKGKEKPVARYLNDFDLLYRKSKDPGVSFSNIRISDVKSAQYLYVTVSYDCLFKGKSSIAGIGYSTKKRIAELKVEKLNNKWKTWIVNIHYLRISDTANASGNNVVILENNKPENGNIAGDSTEANKSRKVAALTTETSNPSKNNAPDGTPGELYKYYIKEALFAESQRKYDEAVKNYNQALVNKPEDAGRLHLKIQELTLRKQNLAQAEIKYAAGQYRDAVDICGKAIKTDPQYAGYYFQKGKSWERLNDLKQAIKDYNKAIEYDASGADVYKARAALFEIDGDYAKAIADYTAYAKLSTGSPFIYHKIAFLDMALGNQQAALEALDKATAITDTIAALFYLKGELLYKLKNANEAIANFSKAIRLDSADPASFFYRAMCRLELRETAKAAEDFGKARKLDTDGQYNKRIQQAAVEFYKSSARQFEAGSADSALKLLDCSIAADPANDLYRFKRGECFLLRNDFTAAIDDYTDAIRINAGNYDAFRQRGVAKLSTKKYEPAIADFIASSKINPKDPKPYKYAGDAYLQLRDYTNAITNYEMILSVYKPARASAEDLFFAEINNNLGDAWFHSGNPFKAIQYFNEAVKNASHNGNFYFNRGQTFLNFNELDQAEDDFRKALLTDDKNLLWNFRLGELYQRKNKYDLAIMQYGIAINLDVNKSLSSEAIYNRAICLLNSNRYTDALKDYRAVKISDRQGFKNFNMELGTVFLNTGLPDSALVYLSAAMVQDSSNATAVYLKAVACVQKNRTDDALYHLEKALMLPAGKLKFTTVSLDFVTLKEDSRFKNLLRKYY